MLLLTSICMPVDRAFRRSCTAYRGGKVGAENAYRVMWKSDGSSASETVESATIETLSTLDAGGPCRSFAARLSSRSELPAATTSTAPSEVFLTVPRNPSRLASRCTNARKPTRCTRPVTVHCRISSASVTSQASRQAFVVCRLAPGQGRDGAQACVLPSQRLLIHAMTM